LWIQWDIIGPSNFTRLKYANVSCIYYETVKEGIILGIGSLTREFALIFTNNASLYIPNQNVLDLLLRQTYNVSNETVSFMNYRPQREIEQALLQIEK
jgi:hypothetical protein